MRFHVEHAVWCPSCGWFGRKARRRNRAADAAGHMRWAAQIAREIRQERRDKVFRETDGGLFARMVELGPDPVPWEALLAPPASDQGWNIGIEAQWPTEIRIPARVTTLHTHNPDQPCGGEATGCRSYQGHEQIITVLPDPTPDEQRRTWFNLPEGGPW
ncbi:hypothetical protein SEA_MAGPIE_90 [Mycobacterium phage Magpie]|uniref:Uncharacterized protein n=1 Tax=Mycobacterium phage Magpie TaxID=2599869 RepID=A0A5J6TE38_9CAUD|nr:hypothetical protein SEA_MAGPIE_90 [Mycobacterium phage Magpie]